MKAELKSDGYIHIVAETVAEAFALKHLAPLENKPCEKCGQNKIPVMFDCSILNDYEATDAI
jgi:hypothetical protein